MRSRSVSWQQLLDIFLKFEHHAGLKIWADELWKLATANALLHLLTQKSELNLNDEEIFPQAYIDNKP